MYSAGIGNPNLHSHDNLPIFVMGGGGGTIKADRHLVLAKDTPLANLYVTLLDKPGVPVDAFGDSSGHIPSLSEV